MLSVIGRTTEFLFYHLLLSFVDRVSRLPRDGVMPEAMRLYRENIALKAQLEAMRRHLAMVERRPRATLGTRALQALALILTRANRVFRRHYLAAPLATMEWWTSKFRRGFRRPAARGGRPPLSALIIDLIVTMKRENRAWGQQRISQELRRMGLRVSIPTVARVLVDNGFPPFPRWNRTVVPFAADVKDALWAIDFFAVELARGYWVQVLLMIDVATREILEMRVHDGWDVDSRSSIRTVAKRMSALRRMPEKIVHDHGPHFMGQFTRQLRVLGVEEIWTTPAMPILNIYVERTIRTIRQELLRHVVVRDVAELQQLCDDFRTYMNEERSHRSLDGQAPAERARGQPPPPLLPLDELARRRLAKRAYAHGLLHGYSLEEGREAA